MHTIDCDKRLVLIYKIKFLILLSIHNTYTYICSHICMFLQELLIAIVFYRIMIKRAQGRKRFGRKNFKQRYFRLTTQDLTYSKTKGKCFLIMYFFPQETKV